MAAGNPSAAGANAAPGALPGAQTTQPPLSTTAPSPPSPSSAANAGNKRKAKKAPAPALLKPVTKRLRMGCLTCRQRKKRCCETRPKCTECARLKLNCQWPKPGTEHKNKNKDAKIEENTIDHEVFGKIKVLRGIVERK